MITQPELPATPLLDMPALASKARVARVLVKDEGERPLGNFKSLGGMRAALRALERSPEGPRRLICASDGNHGLAVAAAASHAGAHARIYLPSGASPERAERIRSQGGEIAWIEGTYDDAVDEALGAAARGEGILVADTTSSLSDRVVRDVMTGYGDISTELVHQLPEAPSHLFVQAGVGGLAAAIAHGLADHMAPPARIIVVEPEAAACVTAALRVGHPVRIPGDLHTCAEMLSCGLASAPAVNLLLQRRAVCLTVGETALLGAAAAFQELGMPTTPSGAAGLAGLLAASIDEQACRLFELDRTSRVLLIVTERDLQPTV